MRQTLEQAQLPMKTVGPIRLNGPDLVDSIKVPLITYETPLWPSVHRGARVSMHSGGIRTVIHDERMTRSILLQAKNIEHASRCCQDFALRRDTFSALVSSTSRFTQYLDHHTHVVGPLIYLRLEFSTGDASGHNMATKAAEAIALYLIEHDPKLRYISVSANLCTDKKTSAVNTLLHRGKYTLAELLVPRDVCQSLLRTDPETIVDINNKKNLIGSIVAGSLCSANAHFANMLLAFYLATGQDAANIVEGSQGIVFAEVQDEALYFSVTLPNLIVGTVGNGKSLPFVKKNLQQLGCGAAGSSGQNARRLAMIAGATVLCGELSLLAAQANPGELIASHMKLERHTRKHDA